jgi:phosphoribosylformylglycinamidine synthase
LKTGTPPPCNLEKEKELHLALRALIHTGTIKSAHDCSEGGLAVALVESCISQQIARDTPRLIGAQIDLTVLAGPGKHASATGNGAPVTTPHHRLDAILFGEAQGRVVISTGALDATKVVERARLLGVPSARIGIVGGDKLGFKTRAGDYSWSVAELHDLWWNSIARSMQ